MALKSGLEVTQDHWKWYHSRAWQFLRYSAWNNGMTLKYGLGVIQCHWTFHMRMTSYWHSMITMNLS